MDRHTIRLQGYDYSQSGYYFVTICTHEREHLFGCIENEKMVLNEIGVCAEQIWFQLPQRFKIRLDVFQIMPNHIHMVIIIVRAIHESPVHRSLLSQIVGYFKANVSKRVRRPLWQRNYYERIIRSEKEYLAIRQYILDNPKNWEEDVENK